MAVIEVEGWDWFVEVTLELHYSYILFIPNVSPMHDSSMLRFGFVARRGSLSYDQVISDSLLQLFCKSERFRNISNLSDTILISVLWNS